MNRCPDRDGAWAFSLQTSPRVSIEPKATTMNRTADNSPDDLERLPGLYRRWELPDVFEPHRQYLIEEAGVHADGTPLYAVYAAVSAIEAPGGEQASGPTDR